MNLPTRIMLVVVLVLSLALCLLCGLGVLFLILTLLVGGNDGIGAGSTSPHTLQVASFAILGSITWMFARISRGLVATLRGREAPNLLPPAVQIGLGMLVGLASIATGIAGLLGFGKASIYSLPIGVLFVTYAVGLVRGRVVERGKR